MTSVGFIDSAIMKMAIPIAFVVLLTTSFLVDGRKDEGMFPSPAKGTYSGCKLKQGILKGCALKANTNIQMGECWSNPRVLRQKFAVFVPFEPGQQNYGSEGGPYGTCTAFDCWPKQEDMEKVGNPANWCFVWDGTLNGGDKSKKKKSRRSPKKSSSDSPKSPSDSSKSPSDSSKSPSDSSKSPSDSSASGSGAEMPSSCPGEKAIPMPIVCPSNLKDCYSADWYEPGGKLAAFGSMKPTYKGPWFSLKGPDHKPLFCPGLNLGCPTPTMRELQLLHLADQKCDVASCKGGSGGGSGGGSDSSDGSSSPKNPKKKKN